MKPDISALRTDPSILEPTDTLLDHTSVTQKKAKYAKDMAELKRQLKIVESRFYEVISIENELKGLKPAVMTAGDLAELLQLAMITKKPITKLFKAYEQSQQHPPKWADRTIDKKPNTDTVDLALALLKKQGSLNNIESYDLLKVIQATKSNTYRQLCRTMRTIQDIAEQIQYKDQLIASQATTIKNQTKQIAGLHITLAQSPSQSLKEKAMAMRSTGKTIKEIANALGKSAPTISKYIKSAANKPAPN